MTQEPHYLGAFRDGLDMHTIMAEAILNRALKTKDERNLGKAANFGVVSYGGSSKALIGTALDYGMLLTKKQALEYIAKLRKANPKIEAWGQAKLQEMISQGWLQTPIGHRRWFPGENRETVARNTPIQSLAAGILKEAMASYYDRLAIHYPSAFMALTVHDELLTECDKGDEHEIEEMKKEEMLKSSTKWIRSVPTDVNTYISNCWEK